MPWTVLSLAFLFVEKITIQVHMQSTMYATGAPPPTGLGGRRSHAERRAVGCRC